MAHDWVKVRWPTDSHSRDFHVLPKDDEPAHSLDHCPCNPTIERDNVLTVTVHTAWDGSKVPLEENT